MSCAGKGYGTNPQSNDYLYTQFNTSIVQTSVIPKTTRNCRKFTSYYPSFTPVLSGLSATTSSSGVYSLVYLSGSNFLPNSTFIKFGNYGYIQPTYYSSFNLSFVIPLNAQPGDYPISVVNLYNGNFSTPINQTYAGNLNFSNIIVYTLI